MEGNREHAADLLLALQKTRDQAQAVRVCVSELLGGAAPAPEVWRGALGVAVADMERASERAARLAREVGGLPARLPAPTWESHAKRQTVAAQLTSAADDLAQLDLDWEAAGMGTDSTTRTTLLRALATMRLAVSVLEAKRP